MIEVATAINSFASKAMQADFVPPSKESVFILTTGQLQDLIKEAIQPLQDHIGSLEARITAQDEKIAALESTQEQDTNRICMDIALDRQRISRLERIEPTPTQRDRADVLHALLAANNGKMLSSAARRKMGIPKSSFSELLRTCDFIEIKPFYTDQRKDVLVLKNSS
jgi:hypothetical protein